MIKLKLKFKMENNLIIVTCVIGSNVNNFKSPKFIKFMLDTGAVISILKKSDFADVS